MSIEIVVHLSDILKERGITQAELSEMSGVRAGTISEIVRNVRTTFNKEHICRIAEVLDIKDISELMTFEEI